MRYSLPVSVLDDMPVHVPEAYRYTPSPMALSSARVEGVCRWVILRKITYGIADDGALFRVEQQEPVHREHVAHAPLPDWLGVGAGRHGSMQAVPEVRVTQSGTDVIVRGHAASPTPVREMLAGVVIGKHMHKLKVFGERTAQWVNGAVEFTEPQWFERVPLRYELAYGGVDQIALAQALEHMQECLGAEEFRRCAAFLKDVLPGIAPICYARNPVGSGYVADAVPQALHGATLPRIELECDLLTPARFAAGESMRWLTRPVPAGMDFMDLSMFPRTAMLGLPPLGYPVGTDAGVAEWEWGQVPAGFSRGNVTSATDEAVPGMAHPDTWRCAPIGLRLPWLAGVEIVSLIGMRADRARWDIRLPGERPVFDLPEQPAQPARMWQLFIDADARRVEILWGRAWDLDHELTPGEERDYLQRVTVKAEVLT